MHVENSTHTRVAALWGVLGFVAGALVIGAAYWIATGDERAERNATTELQWVIRGQVFRIQMRSPREPTQLVKGSWVKDRFIVGRTSWEMRRTDSAAYPFKATVTIPYAREATVYHDSKEEAEADERFYRMLVPDTPDLAAKFSNKRRKS